MVNAGRRLGISAFSAYITAVFPGQTTCTRSGFRGTSSNNSDARPDFLSDGFALFDDAHFLNNRRTKQYYFCLTGG